ncbi:MAG TPA: VOC family protein [Spirillospora sp.]|nr:VOC family protein [Spirillospora sp.]
MTPTFTFDHAIIAVSNLDAATADFRALGFSVFYGGQHADGKTHNALIVFGDGGYLELLAPTNMNFMTVMDTVDLSSFLDFVAKGDGWAGYALRVDDIEAAAAGMRARNLILSGPAANGRKRPDGTQIAWRTFSVDNSRSPFFIADDTPRVRRVPDDADKISHANGVTGVESLVVAVQKLDRGIAHYRAMLAAEPEPGPDIAGAETARFTFGAFGLVLAAPDTFDSPLYPHLKQRGEVPYEIRLRTNQPARAGLLDEQRAHSARIMLVE